MEENNSTPLRKKRGRRKKKLDGEDYNIISDSVALKPMFPHSDSIFMENENKKKDKTEQIALSILDSENIFFPPVQGEKVTDRKSTQCTTSVSTKANLMQKINLHKQNSSVIEKVDAGLEKLLVGKMRREREEALRILQENGYEVEATSKKAEDERPKLSLSYFEDFLRPPNPVNPAERPCKGFSTNSCIASEIIFQEQRFFNAQKSNPDQLSEGSQEYYFREFLTPAQQEELINSMRESRVSPAIKYCILCERYRVQKAYLINLRNDEPTILHLAEYEVITGGDDGFTEDQCLKSESHKQRNYGVTRYPKFQMTDYANSDYCYLNCPLASLNELRGFVNMSPLTIDSIEEVNQVLSRRQMYSKVQCSIHYDAEYQCEIVKLSNFLRVKYIPLLSIENRKTIIDLATKSDSFETNSQNMDF